jgi:3-methyladenine DNA glycosylase/8-oxoguanine DNA glycosylase
MRVAVFAQRPVSDALLRAVQRIYSRLLLGTQVDKPAPVETLLGRIARWSPWRALAVRYLWEDLFWRHTSERIDWLSPLIRL